MSFIQRLFRYFIGIFIGCLLVYFMFPDRDFFGFTPGKVLMKKVREVPLEFSAHGHCKMKCLGLNNDNLQTARKEGEIDFSKSEPQATPKKYHLQFASTYYTLIANTDSTFILDDVGMENVKLNCACDSLTH
jgi:hypothetical protein